MLQHWGSMIPWKKIYMKSIDKSNYFKYIIVVFTNSLHFFNTLCKGSLCNGQIWWTLPLTVFRLTVSWVSKEKEPERGQSFDGEDCNLVAHHSQKMILHWQSRNVSMCHKNWNLKRTFKLKWSSSYKFIPGIYVRVQTCLHYFDMSTDTKPLDIP